ncbi:alpha-L-fucosidase [Saccharicrinis aurantiacus]|uniref:alpha-L-fucosidase n=1 Tax=Saccharicrinis aurantiacus TaxID=1849719 RepID=UPI00248FBB92|nr:alpha-L-fucosidase [Saccharicrinis aurantiacus]
MKLSVLSIALVVNLISVKAQTKYSADWESLQNYQAPEWYEDAKIGFWVHWGVYSVPAFKGGHAAEWYGRWMYCQKGQSSRNNQGLATHLHHNEVYGPPEEFGYKDFIPMFKAENFNANEWADLCVKGGAKFFTMMGAHHDAFCLWDTKLSKWNSVNMGPKRDLVGEMAEAARSKGLKFGVSNHTAWNYCFFEWNHINRYDAVNPAYEDLYGNPIVQASADTIRMYDGETRKTWIPRSRGAVKPSERDMNRWLDRTKELADMYKPDLYYFDWGFNPKEWESRKQQFGAYYYNNAIEAGKGTMGNPNVVINYKGWPTWRQGAAVRDFERGGMNDIADMVWQTDDCVYDDHNWGYVEGTPIKPTNMIVDQLMDIISKRGVLMLSFAPKPDGTFPEEQKTMMYELGDWLNICGEAVYSTRPYEIFGEVGELWGQKNETGHKMYTATNQDIRFTRNKENTILYATILKWPSDGKFMITSMSETDLSSLKSMRMIGAKGKIKFEQSNEGLLLNLPKQPNYKYAYPIKMEFKGQIPSVK